MDWRRRSWKVNLIVSCGSGGAVVVVAVMVVAIVIAVAGPDSDAKPVGCRMVLLVRKDYLLMPSHRTMRSNLLSDNVLQSIRRDDFRVLCEVFWVYDPDG